MSKQWSFLEKGDAIELLLPASGCTREELKSSITWVKEHGFEPIVNSKILKPDMFFASPHAVREKILLQALHRKNSKAIWCVRGGYGSLRLLPRLLQEISLAKITPKLLLGLSDITSLHYALNNKFDWATLHAPVLCRLGMGRASLKEQKEVFDVITGKKTELEFSLKPLNRAAKVKKNIHSKVFGGNLCVYQATRNTEWVKDPAGILFFEDIQERGFRVDRLLHSLLYAKTFTKTKAIVFGEFTLGDEPDGKNFVKMVIQRFADEMSIPILTGLPSGHGKLQRPLPLNTNSTLILGASARLICQTGAIR